MAVPSGAFCNPMPSASAIAPPSDACSMPAPAAPNATPIARPSGMLWSVIASTSKVRRFHDVRGPSASRICPNMCRCGSDMSASRMNAPPSRNPTAAGSQGIEPIASARAIDGASSDQKLAAIITPAAKPSEMCNSRLLPLSTTNTTAAPSAVTPHVKSDATNAWVMGDHSRKLTPPREHNTQADDCRPTCKECRVHI